MAYAEIALALPLDKTFHYIIPENISSKIVPGVRVLVPFGKKRAVGFVLAVGEDSPIANLKEIIEPLDAEPVLSKEMLSLAKWISGNYFSTFGEALFTVIPASLRPPKRESKVLKPHTPPAAEIGPNLSPEQSCAVAAITAEIKSCRNKTFLLHGVTSSGKTEVYLASIKEALECGRSAVFLLPEISLTPQFIKIVQRRFPGLVGVWHSQLSNGERYRTWDAARRGQIKVMLGARSAVFAPFGDLGLIIIDEEHEPTYKQDNRPSYHTREVAIARAKLNNAVVLLGSATPSLESYYNAKHGTYALLELANRIDSRSLPHVKIIENKKFGGSSRILSQDIVNALSKVLARREQAIIFLNRRGFSPGIICPTCGQVWQCPHCAISLVYHRDPEGLKCHYCGYTQKWPGICPGCKETNLALFGVGTQKVEQEIKRLFPQGKIFRLDRDTASKKGVYEKTYEDFKNENFDILLGTQMVAKGFDFPRVTLVGVVDADTALYIPDFRAAERTFQLITQVAGRSGRSDLGGEVIVQTKHPTHYALTAAQKHDFVQLYNTEIEFRRQMNYPPFSRLCNMLLKGRNEEKVLASAASIAAEIYKLKKEHNLTIELLGPTPAAHAKLRNLFRYQILLKGKIEHIFQTLEHIKLMSFSGVMVSIDVDPQTTV